MFPTLAREHLPKNLVWAIVLLCLSYLIFQLIYIPYAALSVDEFWFGHHIYQYTHKIPYRDCLPYKTVLGYYLLSLPMYFSHALFKPLFYIKDEIALINSLFIAISCIWLCRRYQPQAVLYTVTLILIGQLFLIYSVDLRVDMLTSWLGLASMMLLLANRTMLAGLVLAISFMVSQKALWFWGATNIAFGVYWLTITRQWRVIHQACLFNLAFIIPLALYLFIWADISSWSIVLNNVFYEGYTQAKITWYAKIYYQCWNSILCNGPLLIMLWPLTWITMLVPRKNDRAQKQRFFINIYATVMMLLIISYQQAFPYGMVFAVPIYFLIFTDFFSWFITLFKEPKELQPYNQRLLFWFISLYTISLIGISIYIALPLAYYFIIFMPASTGILLNIHHHNNNTPIGLKTCLLLALVFTGFVYPAIRFIFTAYALDGDYQQSTVELANNLLNEGGGYFAGTPLIYNHDQAIPGLKNLIGPALEYLDQPSKELLPIMISSLYLEPRTVTEILQDLKTTPVKFYVHNYRTSLISHAIQKYLQTHFTHYWSSIYIYAPLISVKQQLFSIDFTGTYKVMGSLGASITLDNKKVRPHSIIWLAKGIHTSHTTDMFRLEYLPSKQIKLDWKYPADNWYILTKAIVV